MKTAVIVMNVLAVVAVGLGPVLAHFRVAPPIVGFGIFALGGLLAIVGIVVTTAAFIAGARGPALFSVYLSVAIVIGFVYITNEGRKYPAINDISTDLGDPPKFVFALERDANVGDDMAFPTEFADVIREAYPDIQRYPIRNPPGEVFDRALKTAAEMGWQDISADGKTRIIEAVDESYIFRFKDDIVIRVSEADVGSVVDMRSRSRDGKGDMGANAERIRAFFKEFTPLAARTVEAEEEE